MSKSTEEIFPKGEKAPADYFAGTAWVKMLVPNNEELHCQIGNVIFEPGARNNWHTHPGGQILIATDGIGYYQEKGKPIQFLPDVVHWHGAAADNSFTHIAINTNTQKGIVEWLQRVTDEEYNSFK